MASLLPKFQSVKSSLAVWLPTVSGQINIDMVFCHSEGAVVATEESPIFEVETLRCRSG